MSRRVVTTFDDHDFEQLELLAKLSKTKVQDLVRRIVRSHLDKSMAYIREEASDD